MLSATKYDIFFFFLMNHQQKSCLHLRLQTRTRFSSISSILVTIHFDRTLTLMELSFKADFSFSFFLFLINRYFVTHLHALARETLFSCHQIRLTEFIADLHIFCSRQICHKISEMKLWHVVHNEQREIECASFYVLFLVVNSNYLLEHPGTLFISNM